MWSSLDFFWWGAGALCCQDLLGEPYVCIWASTLMDIMVLGFCLIFGGEWMASVCLI